MQEAGCRQLDKPVSGSGSESVGSLSGIIHLGCSSIRASTTE